MKKDFRPLILVAEDDDSNFKLIKAIIGKKCDILWAKNGEEMLNLYREHTQDAHAILMDIKMPIMTGIELAGWIYQNKPDTKVIIVSGYSDFELCFQLRPGECHASRCIRSIGEAHYGKCTSRLFKQLFSGDQVVR